MPASREFHTISISEIKVEREERQRRAISKETPEFLALCSSIASRGLIHPLLLRRDNTLVAGERRLEAVRHLGLRTAAIQYLDELTPHEAEVAELEENIQRAPLIWQDRVAAIAKYHSLMEGANGEWSSNTTAKHLNLSLHTVRTAIDVVEAAKKKPDLLKFPELSQAVTVVKRDYDRAVASELDKLADVERRAPPPPRIPAEAAIHAPLSPPPPPPEEPLPIEKADFLQWAPSYSGPRFNILHCDFPYGVAIDDSDQMATAAGARQSYEDTPEVYRALLHCLVDNVERILLPSSHAIFWFSMTYFEETKAALSKSFSVSPFPLIWVKSDGRGIIPDPQRGGRRTYETALFLTRGDRKIVKPVANGIAAPTARGFHLSIKPVPVVAHFLSMLVDEHSELLDPTCGSGSALIAAERLHAARVWGLELEEHYVHEARVDLRRERQKAAAARVLGEISL